MKAELIEARAHHAGQISRLLRASHRDLLLAMGIRVHHDLRGMFDQSLHRRAWLLDGRLMGIGGVTGTASSPEGMVWLALSEEALKHSLRIAREVARQIEDVMTVKRRLFTVVLKGDPPAISFCYFLGFRVETSTIINSAPALIMVRDRAMREVA